MLGARLEYDVRRVDPAAHQQIGSILQRDGNLDEAIEAYQAAVAAKPGAARVHVSLAMALFEKGDHAAAAESFRKVTELSPNSPDVFDKLAESLAASGDNGGAEAARAQAAKLRSASDG